MALHADCVLRAMLRGPGRRQQRRAGPGGAGHRCHSRAVVPTRRAEDFMADLGPGPHRRGLQSTLLKAQERSSCLRALPAPREAFPDPAPHGHSGAPAACLLSVGSPGSLEKSEATPPPTMPSCAVQRVPRYLMSSLLDETIEAVAAGLSTAVYQRPGPRAPARRRRKGGRRSWLPLPPVPAVAWPGLHVHPRPCRPGVWVWLVPLTEKAMAPHSSTLAWKIPWTEGPGGLQSMGSRRVGHD